MAVPQFYWTTLAQGAREMRDLWGQMADKIQLHDFEDVPEIWKRIHELADVMTANLEAIRRSSESRPS